MIISGISICEVNKRSMRFVCNQIAMVTERLNYVSKPSTKSIFLLQNTLFLTWNAHTFTSLRKPDSSRTRKAPIQP